MIVLLDTDILIDVALDRAPFAEPAAELLDALETLPGTAFVAWHSISNFYYLVSPHRGGEQTRKFILDLISFVEIAPTTTEHLLQAAQLEMKDFEDSMQVAAALACRAGVIATRNLKDFSKSPIRAAEPHSVLANLLE